MQQNTSARAAAAAAMLAAGLALAGCGSSASSSAGGSATHSAAASAAASTSAATSTGTSDSVPFPVAAGNTWTYDITAATESGTTVNKMTAVTPVAGGQQVTMTSANHLAGVTTNNSETYIFHSDGSITYPLSGFSASGVTVTGSSGILWPSASVIDAGTPTTSTLKLTIKAAGESLATTALVTVQGEGTASVTVPAGTYQATVVLVTERISIEGVTATIEIKTWLAPGIGPVKDQVTTADGGTSAIAAEEQLVSFTKG